MRRILCFLFGHRWGVNPGPVTWNGCIYQRTFFGCCERCGRQAIEHRWAFLPEAGALSYFQGKDYPVHQNPQEARPC